MISKLAMRAELDALLDRSWVAPGAVGMIWWTPSEERDAKVRDHAYADLETRTIYLSHKMLELDAAHREGVLAHEVGHLLAQLEWGSSTEAEADRAALEFLGVKIHYDHSWPGKGLQCTCANGDNMQTRKNPAIDLDEDTIEVERQFDKWKRKTAEHLAEVERALAASPAVRGGEGSEAQMAIKSGELSDLAAGKFRVTFFGPDGPHGHITRNTDREIAEEVMRTLRRPVRPMTDDEVIAWTSTEEFEKGSKVTAFMQAENMLRWLAGKAGKRDWAADIIARANDLGTREGTVNTRGKPYDPEVLDDATSMVTTALGELPRQNSRVRALIRNPPWVTKALADSYEILDDKVPPRWLPQLASVRSGPKASLVANLLEYGCGAYGCVLATLDPGTVLKVTSDESEAEFAATLSTRLVAPICVEYRLVVRLAARHDGRQIHLLWRESAEHVGKIGEALGGRRGKAALDLIGDQHAAAQAAYHAHHIGEPHLVVGRAVAKWLRTCDEMARGPVPELRPLGRGFLEVWSRQRILFGDVHAGNLGMVKRDGVDAWVITDPGNVTVLMEVNPSSR